MEQPRTVDLAESKASSAPSQELHPDQQSSGPVLSASFSKQVPGRQPPFTLDVDFQAAPGFTILFGASGAGKTTLLDCIAGLAVPDSGRVTLADHIFFDRARRINLPVAQRRVGYVFQSLALFPHMTVTQNVQYGVAHIPEAARTHRTQTILQSFRIAHLAERSAREISGGEAQRAALARTLITDPAVLLLDEPLAALDSPTKATIIDDLREWNCAHGIPILYVTHSREEVFALGERVIVLDAGRILAQGTPHEVMTAPTQETVAHLAGFENIFDVEVEAVRPERGTMTCRLFSFDPGKGTASAFEPALSERSDRRVPSSTERLPALAAEGLPVLLETPLVRGGVGAQMRVGIRAGDILLATSPPVGLSARNIIPGRIASLEQRDVIVSARVKCRVEMEVHLTLAARDSLQLEPGKEVWLVIKTHSCHLMQG
jgi:molybdate transport system ATP-binding protein